MPAAKTEEKDFNKGFEKYVFILLVFIGVMVEIVFLNKSEKWTQMII